MWGFISLCQGMDASLQVNNQRVKGKLLLLEDYAFATKKFFLVAEPLTKIQQKTCMTKTGSVPKQSREEFSFWRQSESWGRGQKGTGKGDRLGQNVRDRRGRGEGGCMDLLSKHACFAI